MKEAFFVEKRQFEITLEKQQAALRSKHKGCRELRRKSSCGDCVVHQGRHLHHTHQNFRGRSIPQNQGVMDISKYLQEQKLGSPIIPLEL